MAQTQSWTGINSDCRRGLPVLPAVHLSQLTLLCCRLVETWMHMRVVRGQTCRLSARQQCAACLRCDCRILGPPSTMLPVAGGRMPARVQWFLIQKCLLDTLHRGSRAAYGRSEVMSNSQASSEYPSLNNLGDLSDLCVCGLARPLMAKQDVADGPGIDRDVESVRTCHHSLFKPHVRPLIEQG